MLKGKVAVVTGGSRGIGRAICMELAASGADIAFLYAGNTDAANETCEQLTKMGIRAQSYQCSVADDSAVQSTFKQITADLGTIDILVNNAGVTCDKLAMMMSEEDFTKVVDINLSGAFRCAKQVIPLLVRKRSGKIINITSVSGLMGNPGQCNYAAAKAGLIGFTKTIARELASRGITCNAVAPGFVETDMTAALSAGKDTLTQNIPLKRFAKPEEIAKLVCFLASPNADYITGEVIRIDGGLAI
ncbi:MAG: 3-oxoacyl-[acyl-carrier-protein] reductase [Clostridiales bacterium]|nr:3-oxoacyl-[acyl-carrier-protein] reductase [Clostridiales bacterium]